MKQFFMGLNSSDGKGEMVIKDRRGVERYAVTFGELEELLLITDFTKKSVVLVKQKNEDNQFKIISGGKELFSVKVSEEGTELHGISKDLTIDGDLLEMKFDVMFGYRKVGKVRKRWVSSEDAYELTVFEDDREKTLIGVLAVLNYVINASSKV